METHIEIGIRAEDKSKWETRTPLVPEDIQHLTARGLSIVVQNSSSRAFSDAEYERADIPVLKELKNSKIILGLKEIPVQKLATSKTYFIFSHVIKGQAYNMPMLKQMMKLGVTLVDYERIVDEENNRLIFFGRHAGIAGMINSLWALGLRLSWEKVSNPFTRIQQAKSYFNLDDALQAVRETASAIKRNGIPKSIQPLVVGFAGYGNVSRGAQDVFDLLPFEDVSPHNLVDFCRKGTGGTHRLFKVVFKEKHLVTPRNTDQSFDLLDYYQTGLSKYRSIFMRYADHLTVLINGNYWDPKFPRLLRLEDCQRMWAGEKQPKLKVIGDISCDLDGAVQCTVKPTYPDNPLYVYHPNTGQTTDGVAGSGPVIMAVEILPAEIPRESSIYFSRVLTPYLPEIAAADWNNDFEKIQLPPEIKTATILHKGRLTPNYKYLEKYLD